MEIKTKYSTQDKVWFYLEEINKYGWCKVARVDISCYSTTNIREVVYYLENRYFNKNHTEYYIKCVRDGKGILLADKYIQLNEKDVYGSVEELKDSLAIKHRNRLENLVEVKKNK